MKKLAKQIALFWPRVDIGYLGKLQYGYRYENPGCMQGFDPVLGLDQINSVLGLDHSYEMSFQILKLRLDQWTGPDFSKSSQFVPVFCFASHCSDLKSGPVRGVWNSITCNIYTSDWVTVSTRSLFPFSLSLKQRSINYNYWLQRQKICKHCTLFTAVLYILDVI